MADLIRDVSSSAAGNVSNAGSHVGSENTTSRVPLSGSDSNRRSGSAASVLSEPPRFAGKGITQYVEPSVGSRISPDLLDDWGPSEYQEIVGAMVSNLGETLDAEGERDDGLGSSKLSESAVGDYGDRDLQLMHVSRMRRAQSPPSRFSITSVDPLHYLGVVPTSQNGELLHACKF